MADMQLLRIKTIDDDMTTKKKFIIEVVRYY